MDSRRRIYEKILDSACYSAVYSSSFFTSSFDQLPSEVDAFLAFLARNRGGGNGKNDETGRVLTLRDLEEDLRTFIYKKRTFLTDLRSKKAIADDVESLKARVSQPNVMHTFNQSQKFLADIAYREKVVTDILRIRRVAKAGELRVHR